MKEIRKKLYGVRDYIVRGSHWIDPAWYNEVMDDLEDIFNWVENIKDADASEITSQNHLRWDIFDAPFQTLFGEEE